MNHKKSFELTEELHNKIISVAYGDASLLDKLKVMRAVSRNNEVATILNSYRTTAQKVKQLGEEEFPSELLKAVESKSIPIKNKTNRFINDLVSIVMARPIVSAATSAILIAAAIVAVIINKPVEYKYNYSAAEITLAEKQAKYAFAIVGKYFSDTHSTLQKEVFGSAVAKPFNQSIGITNSLLEGDKNEAQ